MKSIHQLTADDFARIDFVKDCIKAGKQMCLQTVGMWLDDKPRPDDIAFVERKYQHYARLDKILKMTDTELYSLFIAKP